MIKTVDRDVIVIAISLFQQLGLMQLWIEFGTGNGRRWLPIPKYANALGERYCSGILFWYSFTGCDTVSSFSARGKLSAWDMCKAFPEVTDAFLALSDRPNTVTNEQILLLQKCAVLLNDRSSHCMTVNDARGWQFTKKSRTAEGLPPTEDALLQHTRRSVYEGG